jgi:hypothetical protein
MTLIYAPLPPAGTTTYIALAADNLEGDLATSFKIEWDGFKKQYRILQGGEVAPQRSPNGYNSYYTSAIVSDRNGQRWRVFVLGAQYQKRIETVMFMSNVFNPELSATYDRVFQSFRSSLRFTNESADRAAANAADAARKSSGAPTATLPKSKGKFNGLYRAVGVVSGDPHAPQAKIGYKFVAFLPDGRFKEGIPEEGMDKLDEDVEIRIDPVGWGAYEMTGNQGKIVFPPNEYSQAPIVWPIKEYPDRLKVQGDDYTLLDRCNGLKLEGTFRRSDYQTTYSAKQGITFRADGKLSDEGVFKAAGVMVRNPAGNSDFDDDAPGNGIHRVANYTLELTYSNGRAKRTSFYLEPGTSNKSVREFYLNTWKFMRVQ